MNESELMKSALDQGVKLYPSSIYYKQFKEKIPKVLLGFGGLTDDEIKEG
jgi:GntR family transcriptional regulator / MocR family aminotransferase